MSATYPAEQFAPDLAGLITMGAAAVCFGAAYGLSRAFNWKVLNIKGLATLALAVQTYTYVSLFMEQGITQRVDGTWVIYGRWVGMIISALTAYLAWGDFFLTSTVTSGDHDRAHLEGVEDQIGAFAKKPRKALRNGEGISKPLSVGTRYVGAIAYGFSFGGLLLATFSTDQNEWVWFGLSFTAYFVAMWVLMFHSLRSDIASIGLQIWLVLAFPMYALFWGLAPAGSDWIGYNTESWVMYGLDIYQFIIPVTLMSIFYSRPENVMKQQKKGDPLSRPWGEEAMDDGHSSSEDEHDGKHHKKHHRRHRRTGFDEV